MLILVSDCSCSKISTSSNTLGWAFFVIHTNNPTYLRDGTRSWSASQRKLIPMCLSLLRSSSKNSLTLRWALLSLIQGHSHSWQGQRELKIRFSQDQINVRISAHTAICNRNHPISHLDLTRGLSAGISRVRNAKCFSGNWLEFHPVSFDTIS